MQKIVLITGCSSGIGTALALEFHHRGHSVIATARRHSALAPLAEKGIRTLVIDVDAVSYTHLRAHETVLDLVCRLLLDKKNTHAHQHTQKYDEESQ